MANELQTAFEKLTNQARFVQMIVDKQLVVSNRKKADIVNDLRKHKFRPFPKVAKAAASGETEPVVEEEEEDEGDNGADSDYDYLLGMAIWSLTKEKVGPCHMVQELVFMACFRSNGSTRKRRRRRQNCSSFSKRRPKISGTRTSISFCKNGRFVK